MRTSFSEALLQLLLRLGLSALWIQLIVWLLALAVMLMGLGTIFLSAGGLGWINGFGLALYMVLIMGVKFSPILWAGATGTAVVVAQPGGEENLSAKDALEKVIKWSPKIMNWMDKGFVFWVPAWILYTTLSNMAGMAKWNILLFVLIPALLWFVEDEWPGGRLVRRLIGYTLVIGATLVVGFTIYNTMNHVVADPGVPLYQSYLDDLNAEEKKNIEEVVKTIIANKKAGKEISELDRAILKKLEERAKAQRLNPASIKTAIETARPADPSWWKANWVWVAGVALALFIAIRVWKAASRPTVVTATGAVVTSAGHGTTAKRSFAMSVFWLALAIGIGWFAYSYFTGEIGYRRTIVFERADLQEFELCGIRPGKRVFVPAEPVVVILHKTLPNGRIVYDNSDVTKFLLVNDTVTGEPIEVGNKGCVKGGFSHPKEVRDTNRFVPQRMALTFR